MNFRIVKWIALAISIVVMTGCVTTTDSRFDKKVSVDEAVQNYVALGYGYFSKGELQRAKAKLDRALELDPDASEAHHVYALIWQNQDEPELAEEHFEHALDSNSKNSRARHAYGLFLLSRNELDDACDELEEATEDTRYAKRYLAFSDLGLCQYRNNDVEDAIASYQKSVRLNRLNVDALINLTTIFLELDEPQNAARYYDRFTNLVTMRRTMHSAYTLSLGIRVAQLRNDRASEAGFARQLQKQFPKSSEYQAYKDEKMKRG